MQINKLIQLNGKYIKGNISNRVVTIDSLHIELDNNAKKVKFTIPELNELINELTIVRNEMDGNATVKTPQFYD